MKTIETEIWIPSGEGNKEKYAGQRKAIDVFKELESILKEEKICPPWYFNINDIFFNKETEFFPPLKTISCYASWGNNEGIFIDIDIYTYVEKQHKCNIVRFATGRSLEESVSAYDRMQYIAGYIYRLFMGNGRVCGRWLTIRKDEPQKNMLSLLNCLESEGIEDLKQRLYHQEEVSLLKHVDELLINLMIIKAVSKCQPSESRLKELKTKENILAYFREVCGTALLPDTKKFEELILSYDSF